MKKSSDYIVIVSFAMLIFYSCVKESDKFKRNYTLENGTKHKIELKFYKDGNQYFIGDNILDNTGDIFLRSATDQRAIEASALSAYQGPDSLVIYFSDSHKAKITWDGKTSKLEGINKNLLFDEAYTKENNENYRYVFTNEDFNNAIEIKQ